MCGGTQWPLQVKLTKGGHCMGMRLSMFKCHTTAEASNISDFLLLKSVNMPYLPIVACDPSVQSAWLLVILFGAAGFSIVL